MRRKLTPEEKQKLADHARQGEKEAHPEADSISVTVGDEVGDDGQVQVNVHRFTVTPMPPGWKP